MKKRCCVARHVQSLAYCSQLQTVSYTFDDERCGGQAFLHLRIGSAFSIGKGEQGRASKAAERACHRVGSVFRIFETDIPFAECFDTVRNTCPLAATCRLRGYVVRALEAFYHELDMVTLEDLVRGNCGLIDLLAMRPDISASCSSRSAFA